MRPVLKVISAATIFATLLIAGCAVSTGAGSANQPEVSPWRGRLALRIEADLAQSASQSFSAGFELTGNAQTGELTLYTPLGTTAAALSWSPQVAVLRSNGESRHFESLDALLKQAVGTEVPVAALFAWLAGDNMTVAGWRADLSQHANGRITAHRTEPAPPVELRLVFEHP